jgi:hypothetical protein
MARYELTAEAGDDIEKLGTFDTMQAAEEKVAEVEDGICTITRGMNSYSPIRRIITSSISLK